MPNPFFYGGRITDAAQFVGREAEMRRIFGALETAHTGQLQSVSVVGRRRMGRSSLLYHLTQVYPHHLTRADDYRFAYVDLESAECRSLGSLLRTVLWELGVVLPAGDVGQIGLAEFEERIKALDVHPVVCLDEFEQLIESEETRREFPPALYDSWRSLMNGSHLALVTASQAPLERLSQQKRLTSPFFNVFRRVPLGELTTGEAEELVGRGRPCDRPFTEPECQGVLWLGRRHPYHLQAAGSLLYEAKAGGRAGDWAAVRRDLRRQMEPASWWWRGLRAVDDAIQAVGRVALHVRGRPTEDERILRIVGAFVLLAILLVAGGALQLDVVQGWVKLLGGGG